MVKTFLLRLFPKVFELLNVPKTKFYGVNVSDKDLKKGSQYQDSKAEQS